MRLFGGCRQLIKGITRVGDIAARRIKAVDGATLRGFQVGFGIAQPFVDTLRHRLARGGHKSVVHRGVERGCARIGDFGRHGAGFLIDVVFELRRSEIAGQDRGHVGAEILRYHERRVRIARFHRLHRLVAIDEIPSELIVVFELVDNLRAQVKVAQHLVMRARILVHHADAQIARILIRVPEPYHVEPRI